MIETRIVPYAEEAKIGSLIGALLRSHAQFSVVPYPNDLKAQNRTGWMVTWPTRGPSKPKEAA